LDNRDNGCNSKSSEGGFVLEKDGRKEPMLIATYIYYKNREYETIICCHKPAVFTIGSRPSGHLFAAELL